MWPVKDWFVKSVRANAALVGPGCTTVGGASVGASVGPVVAVAGAVVAVAVAVEVAVVVAGVLVDVAEGPEVGREAWLVSVFSFWAISPGTVKASVTKNKSSIGTIEKFKIRRSRLAPEEFTPLTRIRITSKATSKIATRGARKFPIAGAVEVCKRIKLSGIIPG